MTDDNNELPPAVKVMADLAAGMIALNGNIVRLLDEVAALKDVLQQQIDVHMNVSEKLDTLDRAMEILEENRRGGKVGFGDFSQAYTLAIEEMENEPEEEGPEIPERP